MKEEGSHRAETRRKPRGVTRHRRSAQQAVQRALQLPDVPGHDMGIDLGGLYVRVAEEFLEHADVHPVFQHMGGKTVPQGVTADLLVDPGLLCGPFHRLLQPGFEHMMAHLPARARVKGALPCRKHPLPAGLPPSPGVFPGQGLGDIDLSEPSLKIQRLYLTETAVSLLKS